MKLQRLNIAGFIGARSVSLDLSKTCHLIAGPNGAGKSSIRDAIALALTADLGRVSLKKEAGQLVTTGASAASVELTDVDGDTWAVTISAAGKIADSQKGREPDPILPYVLDAQRLARLDPTERRAFLFGVTGAKMDAGAVKHRLATRGCEAGKVERILPLLRSGFPAAAAEAQQQTTQARGAWKALTGEAYGAVKAAAWRAPAATFSAASMEAALQALAAVDEGIAKAQRAVGNLEAVERALSDARRQRAGLQEAAAQLVRRKTKLATDEAGLKDAQAALDRATEKAGNGRRLGLVHDLARSLHALLMLGVVDFDSVVGNDAANARDAYVDQYGGFNEAEGDSEARASLPNLTDARDLMASAVRNAMRDLKLSEAAEAQIKLLDDQIAKAGDGGAAELDVARKHLATAQAERKTAAAAVDTLRAAKAAAEGAAKKTADAAKHHVDVEAWERIATALAPDGIPGEILAEALGPINTRLAQSALDAQWPAVVIAADMGITYGGRAYGLCSESERYRADAMLAEAVAHISGARLLVLDRFDVLDLQGRTDLIEWLDCLADNGEIDTALIFGTLKALPAGLPATFAAHWIEGGRCVEEAREPEPEAVAA